MALSDETPAKGSANAHRPEIDGLRAVAVLSVCVYHLRADSLPGGYLGVDVFFAISGFVVMSSILRAGRDRTGVFLANFYLRRVKRIVPALMLCILGSTLFGFMFIPNIGQSLKTGMLSLVGAGNLFLFSTHTEYGAVDADYNLFTQTWSLGVEEQFYLVLPALFVLTVSSARRQSGRLGLLLTTLGLATISSLVAYFHMLSVDPSAAFYLPMFRGWELFAGCILAVIYPAHPERRDASAGMRALQFLLATVSLSVVIATFVWPEELALLGMPTATVLAGTLVFIATTTQGHPYHEFLQLSPVQFLGRISYSFYLWHWSVIVLLRWTVGLSPWSMGAAIAATLFLSTLSFYVVERPLRHAQWSRTRGRSLLYGGLATFSAIGLMGLAGLFDNAVSHVLYTGDERFVVGSKPNDARVLLGRCPPTGEARPDRSCMAVVEAADGNGAWELPRSAVSDGRSSIVFVGDSHAAQLMHPFIQVAGQERVSVPIVTMKTGQGHVPFILDALRKLIRPGDTVIFALASDRLYASDLDSYVYSPNAQIDPELVSEVRTLVTHLSRLVDDVGGTTILVDPVPKICSVEAYSRAGIYSDACVNDWSDAIDYGHAMREIFAEVEDGVRSTRSLDVFSGLCAAPKCGVIDAHGNLVFGDSSPHVTKFVQDLMIESDIGPSFLRMEP